MSRTITITIDPMAGTTVEADGFQGQGCEAATKAIEEAVAGPGGTRVKEYKPEYKAVDTGTTQKQTTRMG